MIERPRVEAENRLERLAADDQRIHGGHELLIAVGFATAWWQEVEIAVGSCDEPVDARTNKDGCLHCPFTSARLELHVTRSCPRSWQREQLRRSTPPCPPSLRGPRSFRRKA